MRPLYLILLVLSLGGKAWGAAPVTITVCASGCDNTTMAAAYATATVTTDVIELRDNSITDESLTFGKNIAGIQGSSIGVTWGAAGTNTQVTFTNGVTQPVFVRDLSFSKSGSNNVISNSGLGVGSKFTIQNIRVSGSSTNALISMSQNYVTASQVIFDRVFVNQSGNTFACRFSAGTEATAGAVLIKNSLFKSPSSIALQLDGTSATICYKLFGIDVVGSSVGLVAKGAVDVENSIFSGNTTDLSLTSPAAASQFTYSGFGNSIASLGTGSITITAPRTFCDQNNYYISPASLTLNAGVSIDGVTGVDIGLNGVMQGSGNVLGMGCNPYSPALCGGYGAGK